MERQQQALAAKDAALSDLSSKLEAQQAAALATAEELERQRKALEAARRGLAGTPLLAGLVGTDICMGFDGFRR